MSKKTVIFDLDGTIAIIDKRRDLSTKENGKIDWDVFFNSKNIEMDEPNEAVIKTLQSYKKNGYKIIILSGRLETSKEATLAWLSSHKVCFDEIKMRKNTPSGKYVSGKKHGLFYFFRCEDRFRYKLETYDNGQLKHLQKFRKDGTDEVLSYEEKF